MVAHACNTSTKETEMGGFPLLQGQSPLLGKPRPQNEVLFKKTKQVVDNLCL